MEKHFSVMTKQFAETLAFLGFRYTPKREKGGVVYNFEDTEVFRECLEHMIKFRKEQKNKIKRAREIQNYENYNG